MKISVKVDYACRVLAEMARLQGSGELAQIDHLAKTEAVPANFLAQILSELRNAGLVISKRGIQGGYALARSADQISLYDIMTAIDGDLLELSGNHKGRSGPRVKEIWLTLRDTLHTQARPTPLIPLSSRKPPTCIISNRERKRGAASACAFLRNFT